MENPPVNLKKIAIGRGGIAPTTAWGNPHMVSNPSDETDHTSLNHLSKVALAETFPQLINYDPAAYEYIKEQYVYLHISLCSMRLSNSIVNIHYS